MTDKEFINKLLYDPDYFLTQEGMERLMRIAGVPELFIKKYSSREFDFTQEETREILAIAEVGHEGR